MFWSIISLRVLFENLELMKNRILLSLFVNWLVLFMCFMLWSVYADDSCEHLRDKGEEYYECVCVTESELCPYRDDCPNWCCGIKLNTNFPIIWNCIESANATGAFPMMVWALTKIIMSLILVVCFIMIIVWWVLWAWDNPKKGQDIIKKVAITILLLWFSGVILRLINPNFFG